MSPKRCLSLKGRLPPSSDNLSPWKQTKKFMNRSLSEKTAGQWSVRLPHPDATVPEITPSVLDRMCILSVPTKQQVFARPVV